MYTTSIPWACMILAGSFWSTTDITLFIEMITAKARLRTRRPSVEPPHFGPPIQIHSEGCSALLCSALLYLTSIAETAYVKRRHSGGLLI